MTFNAATADQQESPQSALMRAIDQIRSYLERRVNAESDQPPVPILPLPAAAPLTRLCQTYGLADFERNLLLLLAGVELDPRLLPLCAAVQGDPQRQYPTLGLALTVLPQPNWGALAPNAALRRWQLIEVGAGNTLTSSPLRLDEQILHYLVGINHLNDQLVRLGTPLPIAPPLVASHQRLAEQMIQTWLLGSRQREPLPVLQLCGRDAVSQRAIAATVCTQLGLQPYTIAAELLPTDFAHLHEIQKLWEREYCLNRVALLIECSASEAAQNQPAIEQLLETGQFPLMVLSRERRRPKHRALLVFEVASPATAEQRVLWQAALAGMLPHLNGQVERLTSHFNLNAAEIYAACARTQGQSQTDQAPTQSQALFHAEPETMADLGQQTLEQALWQNCRTQARPRLDELAQRIDSTADWQDLVLPDHEKSVLQAVASQLRYRSQVYEQWGFGDKSQRGLGISALFAGASGTGKTLAAEVLAAALQLDLYRVDLSAVVSKYIGETEKNLGRVFDAAETGGVILLFDEADALFGKRSEVKDSHDRYANMEVSYLLQRMEAYRGLAILTTNLKGAIDQAFLRRIRFIVQFPFPDASQRAEIWRRIFPAKTPTEGLDATKLARLNLAGGNIRNIALNAAFIAAESGQPVRMEHLLQAARSEYIKLERPLTDVEVKGWISS